MFDVCAALDLCSIRKIVPVDGGHRCRHCRRPVHALCLDVPVNQAEGYGSAGTCLQCAQKTHGLVLENFNSPKGKLQDLNEQFIVMDPLRAWHENKFIYDQGKASQAKKKKDERLFKKISGNIIGKLYRLTTKLERYEVVWTSTAIQNQTSVISRSTALAGYKKYVRSKASQSQLDWDALSKSDGASVTGFDGDSLEDLEEHGEAFVNVFDEIADKSFSNRAVNELESLSNLNWIPNGEMEEPLHKHNAKATLTNPKLFQCTPMKAFLRYIPLAFWKQA